jgi:hypothetical protein
MPFLGRSSRAQVRNARTPAERMRLFRRRRKFRRQVVKVEVDPGEVDALIDRGYLHPKDRDDPEVLERDEFRFVHILSLPSSVSTVRVKR